MQKLFNLVDGRKALWQWDVNRFIYAFGCQQIHYSQLGEILAVEVEDDMAAVPNEMLQNAADIRIMAYVTVDGNFTACDEHLSVIARPMPPGYIYTPTQIITFESLVEDVRNELLSLEARAQAGDFDGKDGEDGKDGKDAIITGATATINSDGGAPSVDVTAGGTPSERSFAFAFHNIGGGGASAWSDLTDKPFETLGRTLKTVNGVLDVNTSTAVEQDNTLPITSAAVYTEVGNINALLGTI